MLYRIVSLSRGQGLVEYAFIILLMSILLFGAVALLGPQLTLIFGNMSKGL